MRKRLISLGLAFVLCALWALGLSAQVTNLTVTKSGNDVLLSFSGTSGPWHVVRSQSPIFNYNNVLLADVTTTNPLTDATAASLPELWFYDASDVGAGETPADNGQPSEAPIVLTSLSPNTGWENQSITINGTGFSTVTTDNHPFFGVLPAVVTAATSTSLTVTVPVGVTTGPVIVQNGNLTSNSLTFTAVMESTYGGNSFQNISSIAFDSLVTQHLFFSDMGSGGTANYLYEIMDDYSITQRVFWNQMKGLPIDASGNLYFANTTLTSNAGLIKKCAAGTYTLSTYTNAKKYNETDSVSVVGLVYRSDGIIFAADRYHNSIRKRDPSLLGASDFVLGYTLDLYMGMAMDSAQNLYFTSGGNLYKTPTSGSSSVSTVATGFTSASGIAIDESMGNVVILLADRGAGNIYLINPDTGYRDIVGSGFNSPRAVAFGKDKATGELYYYVAEATRVLRLPDPKIKIDSNLKKGNIKVLISKKGPGGQTDQYPVPSLQTADAQIKIPFDIDPAPTADTFVYVKLYDPADVAPYATTGVNDNLDLTKNGGNDTAFQACLSSNTVKINAGTTHGEVTLTITNQYAGDNYQVGFSFDSNFIASGSTVKPLVKTGILTAWKRGYIECDKMFQKGGLLYRDYGVAGQCGGPGQPACCGSSGQLPCNQIMVYDWTTAQTNDSIVVFDETNTAENGGETRHADSVVDNGDGTKTITLNSALTKNYLKSFVRTSPPLEPDFSDHSGGVGVIGSSYWEVDLSDLSQPFNDAFVQFQLLTTDRNAVPLISRDYEFNKSSQLGRDIRTNFHVLWTHTVNGDHTNFFHFIGAAGAPHNASGDLLGDTVSTNNRTVIFLQTIHDWCTVYGINETNTIRGTCDHEESHQYQTNTCNTATDHHCTRQAWCAGTLVCPSEPCLNQAGGNSNFNNSINRMCIEDLLNGDPTCSPQSPSQGSVRGAPDPQ